MATSNIVNTLGAGSGIDTKTLAKDLMEATREPRKAIIEEKISKSEARISGYGVIKYSLGELKTAFEGLNDLSDFSSLQTANTQPSALSIVASPTAAVGSYLVEVTQVAQAQRSASNGFEKINTKLNNGQGFNLALAINGTPSLPPIDVEDDTPEGVVSAINAAKRGLSAQLIQTSGPTPWRIVVTGQEGANNAFTLNSVDDGGNTLNLNLDLNKPGVLNQLQPAQNAKLTVNSLPIERSSNTVSDVVNGVTFNIATTTTLGVNARIDLTRDTSGITTKVENLVTAYKSFEENLVILGDRDSEVDEFGGALAGDTLMQNIRTQVRAMLTTPSSTPGTKVTAPRDIGLSFDRYGVLQFDKTKLSTHLQNNFEDVTKMFSANTNNKSVFSSTPGGVAGDAVSKLDKMMRSTGSIAQQTNNATKQVDRFKTELLRLEDQMKKLLERYTRQFSAMESIVGSSISMRESLKGTFEGLANFYKK
jgi:flagellar hook-associated protein 2